MAGHAAYVLPFVWTTPPAKVRAIASMALKTRFIGLCCRQPGWVDDVFGFQCINVLGAVAMTALAGSSSRIRQEFAAFAMSVQSVELHSLLMALHTLRSNNNRLCGLRGLCGGLWLRLLRWPLRWLLWWLLGLGFSRPHQHREKADKAYNKQYGEGPLGGCLSVVVLGHEKHLLLCG